MVLVLRCYGAKVLRGVSRMCCLGGRRAAQKPRS